MKIIDAHLHLVTPDPYFDGLAQAVGHRNNPQHLEQVYKELDIRCGIVMGNREPRDQGKDLPPFLRYCVGLDSHFTQEHPLQDAIAQVEEHLRQESCVGLKLYPGYCCNYITDPVYQPFLELAQTYHKPVALHTGATAGKNGLLKYSHPLTVDEAAVRFPQVQFILCHFGNPWVLDASAVMEKNDNVAADLSGLLEGPVDLDGLWRESGGYLDYLKTWMNCAGGWDRFLFGTDWPLVNMAQYVAFIARLVPPQHLEKVFFHNANRIYQLGL